MSDKIFQSLRLAVKNLDEILKVKKNDITRDAAIKRFELCFDLSWKAIKNYATKEGLECYSPRGCLKAAYQLKLIEYEDTWFAVVEDRNVTAHLYDAERADEVYKRLPGYLDLFINLVKKLG